jgi:protein-L-isoaspartate(D-aspartate) O-methyltransferase
MNLERFVLLAAIFFGCEAALAQRQPDNPSAARRLLVERDIVTAGITNQRVIDAILNTPRHEFVPIKQRKNAYFDMSLPIGANQTISSPFIVAYMTEALDPQPTDKVLEIGTGSGYQAAVLSPLVRQVYTIEIVESLGHRARHDLKRLDYDNVTVKIGDGFKGWEEFAPYDKIIVTCSPEDVPQPLIDQLAAGGKMIVPVGQRYQQVLYMYTKDGDELRRESLRPTLFVPMTGEAERQRVAQPDPQRPTIANGSFEQRAEGDHEFSGWYYQRQVQVHADAVPDGDRCANFHNDTPGRASHALQGFAVDGRHVNRLVVSAAIRLQRVREGENREMMPAIIVSFYDAQRAPLGQRWLGPWQGSLDWQRVSKRIPVPKRAREAILRIGLFGATGDLYVDDVSVAGQGGQSESD